MDTTIVDLPLPPQPLVIATHCYQHHRCHHHWPHHYNILLAAITTTSLSVCCCDAIIINANIDIIIVCVSSPTPSFFLQHCQLVSTTSITDTIVTLLSPLAAHTRQHCHHTIIIGTSATGLLPPLSPPLRA